MKKPFFFDNVDGLGGIGISKHQKMLYQNQQIKQQPVHANQKNRLTMQKPKVNEEVVVPNA